jgi:hypothetical protein
MKVAKTKLVSWWDSALAGTTTKITKKEISDVYRVLVANRGRILP